MSVFIATAMKKRALIVGISDYAQLQPTLRSSSFESEQWRELLTAVYGFADHNILRLSDAQATKSAILDRLTWLLADSRPGDQLVFIFCGHGVRIRRDHSAGDDVDLQDEAIVAYPAGAADPADASIFDDDLTSLYCTMSVAKHARPTFIFDCCYSAGFDFAEPEHRRTDDPSGVANRTRDLANFVRFGSQLARSAACTHPLVVAASGEYDIAVEVKGENRTRSLFSSLAIAALRKNPALTYDALVSTVTPQMEHFRQKPSLAGDPIRIQQPFFS